MSLDTTKILTGVNYKNTQGEISSYTLGGGSGTDRLQWKCDNIKSLEYECYNSTIENVDEMFNGLDTSNVFNMRYMFYGCNKLTSLDLSSFNTSSVIYMRYMFHDCNKLTSLDLSSFNTSKVTDMGGMFYDCRALTTLDLSSFNTSKVTSMNAMFGDCYALTSLNVSSFDTSKVTNMGSMFSSCSGLTSLDLSNFNTSSVTDMGSMFIGCNKLTSLDLSNFNTSKVTNMYNMFWACRELTSLNVSNFNTSNVTNMGGMFYGCGNLTTILGTLDLIKATSLSNMFANCTKLTTFTLKNIKKTLQIGSGTSYGTLLDDATIINTAKELWDLTGTTSQTLTVATAVSAKLDTIYVKLIDATEEMIANDPNITSKKPCEVCSETDGGAMTLREYIVSKNWTISG